MNIQDISHAKKPVSTRWARIRRYGFGLFGFPVIIVFVLFAVLVWRSDIAFSYKLVGIFLAVILTSNMFSKLAVRILRNI